MKALKDRSYYWANKKLICPFCDCEFILEKEDINNIEETTVQGTYIGIKLNCPRM